MKFFETVSFNFCKLIREVNKLEAQELIDQDCFDFVIGKLNESPIYVKFGIKTLTILLNFSIFLKFGKGLSRLNLLEKKYIYYQLKTSRISFKRDLLKFYESFILLKLYEDR